MADDLGGDALAHLAFGLRIDRQREIGMGFDVDKTRRDREPRGVDDLARGAGNAAADRRDAAARDRQIIAGDAGIAGTVEQDSAADDDVVHRARLSWIGGAASGREWTAPSRRRQVDGTKSTRPTLTSTPSRRSKRSR